jgi:FPC/CPF motif-containing protein YcgG
MAKTKKTKKEEVVEFKSPEVTLRQKKYEECEWCFQFDEDEPQVFAWTDDESDNNEDPKVIFTITNVENSYITFQEGKSLRQKQKEAFKNYNNESENKEAEA